MKKNAYKLKNGGLLCNCILSFAIVLASSSCQTTSKNKKFFVDQSFAIQWSYLSPSQKTQPVTSHVYIKGRELLRLDFVVPFRGVVGRFVLNKNKMMFQMPLKKEFYEGAFNSQLFLPQFDAFPASWFFAILKGKPLKNWKCSSISKNKTTCNVKDFTVQWTFKNSMWSQAYLINSRQEKIKIKRLKGRRKYFAMDVFSLPVAGYKKQSTFSME